MKAAASLQSAIALAIDSLTGTPTVTWMTVGRFIATAMCLLAMLKLQDVDRFATMFLGYDLLAQRVVPYAYAYPYAELGAGALMLADVADFVSAPLALLIGTIGAASVFKAVYLDRRELRCACVGSGGNVPLGFVSLMENLMMIGMAAAMLAGALSA